MEDQVSQDQAFTGAPAKKRSSCKTCLVIFLVGLALIGGCSYYTFTKAKPAYNESMALMRGPITDSLKSYDLTTLKSQMTSDLSNALETTTSVKLFDAFREKLGPIQSIDETKVSWKVFYGKNSVVDLTAPAKFEKGEGTLNLNFKLDQDDHPKLNGLKITSPLLIP